MKFFTNVVLGLAAGVLSLAAQAATITYYHNDLASSPVVATNEHGDVVWRESYRPYRERTVNSAAAKGNKVWFTSRRQDVETGLVYMGARYYDPLAGRFLSTDPVHFDEGNLHSFNRYAYANNNPYKYVDPDGRSPALAARAFWIGYRGANALGARQAGEYIGARLWAALNEGHETPVSGEQQHSKPSLLDPKADKHVLEGDGPGGGGGHRPGTGKAGKSEFPASWSDDKIRGEISDIATDPKATLSKPDGRGYVTASGTRDGVDIKVVIDTKAGRIVTGYPTNLGINP